MCRRQGLAGKFSPRVLLMSSSNQYKKPTSIFFISWVFFRLLKRKKILKRENDKKKKILVHEIKIFFLYNLVLVYVDLLGAIYSVPQTPAR